MFAAHVRADKHTHSFLERLQEDATFQSNYKGLANGQLSILITLAY